MNIAGIKVNIAGIKINIVVDNEDKQLRNLGRYSQFIIRDKNNTSRPDVKIELKKSSFFNFNLDDKDIVVDNKYWSLYNKNGYKIFRLKASKQGSGIFAKLLSDKSISSSTWVSSFTGTITLGTAVGSGLSSRGFKLGKN